MAAMISIATDRSHTEDSFPWSRFPASWAVGDVYSERVSARLIWLLVPLQYYVFTHVAGGVAPGDLLSVVAITMASFAALFVISFVLANLATLGDSGVAKQTLTRMWMIALMLGTTGTYAVFALSLFVGLYMNLTADILGDFFFWHSREGVRIPGWNWQTPVTYLVYSTIACILISVTRWMFWRLVPSCRAPLPEPAMAVVIVFVATVMFGMNILATL
ncbi:MAG TPA: hypothetical protein VHB49_08585 [Bradyrhizobium sp.]|nr:hypothetical protein [Bradyrhizobium sp.]